MPLSLRHVLTGLALFGLSACSLRDAACGSPKEQAAVQRAEVQASVPSAVNPTGAGPFRIIMFGDSLTAGLGLLSDNAYPALLQRKFLEEGYANVEVVNASISGDTSAGGANRIEGSLEPGTRILVLALGGNDALRGLTPQQTYDNLAAIIDAALAKNVRVMLAGMEAPTNLGEDYRTAFRATFLRLARDYRANVTYVPFLLEGVAGNPALNQTDGIHPNKEGARVVADNLYPKLKIMVDSLGGGG
jgi:acyl-CoA thioesterase I